MNGQAYVDAVADKASTHAASVLKADVEAVLAVVHGGDTFEDVRRRLVDSYTQMDPKALFHLTFAAQTMAHLAGRAAVVEDST